MIKIETVKKITKAVVGTSVWWTVGNIIDNNVTPENRRQKVEVYIGSAAIGWVVTEQSSLYIDRTIDKIFKRWIVAQEKKEPIIIQDVVKIEKNTNL